MLVKGRGRLFASAEATVALLDHLCIGDQTVKGDVYCAGGCNQGKELVEGNDDTADGIGGFEIPMYETVEIKAQNISIHSCDILLNVAVFLDEGCDIVRDSH
jgi:hypothetical protein